MNSQFLGNAIQFNLLSSISTGYIFVDTIIGMMLLSLTPYIGLYLRKYYDLFSDFLSLGNTPDNSITLKGAILRNKYKSEYNYSKSLRALFWYIKQNLKDIDGISKLIELTTNRETYWSNDGNDLPCDINETNLIINQRKEIKLKENVMCTIDVYDREGDSSDKGMQKVNEIVVILYGTKCVFEVKVFLDNILEAFDNHIVDSMTKNQLYFTMEDDDKLSYSEYIFDCNTSFDTIFFDKKEEVKKELDFFLKNRSYYLKKGLPYRYGMLLYGKPGCGKTSLIKAIAKYTGRHIININVNLIKNRKMLEDIFYNNKINKYDISNDKKIYVIEEFDVNAIELLKDRGIDYSKNMKTSNLLDYETDSNNSVDYEKDSQYKITDDKVEMTLEHFKKMQVMSVSQFPKQKDNITLGDLLQVLDGLIECSGRMLIVTTNDFSKIDKALLRAGRIDRIIEFDKLKSKELIQLYRFFFKTPSDKVESYINSIDHGIIEAAEFVAICRNNLNSSDKLLKSLKSYVSSR